MKKCNFKKEATGMFGSAKPTCTITNEDCVGEKDCVFYRRNK